jgi:peptidoglycan/xylan/chitin deacetylase (PgdA/CDA1 family)
LSAGLASLNAESGAQDANSKLRPAALTFDDGFRDFYTHAFPTLQAHGFRAEIADSKAQIEHELGARVKAFAYPFAFPQTRRDFVSRFKNLLMTGGYETCVTTQIGRHRPGADSFQIKRLPVNSDDDSMLFQAKLEGSYDWLALPQTVMKSIKRRLPGLGKANGYFGRKARSCEPAQVA